MRLGIKDHKVIRAFVDRVPLEGHKISTDGKRLDGHWLGGSRIADWQSGEIVFHDLGSSAAQSVQKQVRYHAAPNMLRETRVAVKAKLSRRSKPKRGTPKRSVAKRKAHTRIRRVRIGAGRRGFGVLRHGMFAHPYLPEIPSSGSQRELYLMASMLRRAGYDTNGAKILHAEGMGLSELESRLRIPPGEIGSLSYTHGIDHWGSR